jgi:hypothetical protein
MIVNVLLLVLLIASPVAAQVITNADLGKRYNVPPAGPDVYAALKQREYHAPPTVEQSMAVWCCSEPRVREQEPPRRLDGTRRDSPILIYGVLPYDVYSSSNVFIHPRSHNDKRRHR